MLHRGKLSSGRSSVAHDPRPALAIQLPPRPLRPVEYEIYDTQEQCYCTLTLNGYVLTFS